jgi:hypothetical protein
MRYWCKFTIKGERWQEISEFGYRGSIASIAFWMERDGRVPEWAEGMMFAEMPADWTPPDEQVETPRNLQ